MVVRTLKETDFFFASFCLCFAARIAFLRSFSISFLRSFRLLRCSASLSSSILSARDKAVLRRRPLSDSVEDGYLKSKTKKKENFTNEAASEVSNTVCMCLFKLHDFQWHKCLNVSKAASSVRKLTIHLSAVNVLGWCKCAI